MFIGKFCYLFAALLILPSLFSRAKIPSQEQSFSSPCLSENNQTSLSAFPVAVDPFYSSQITLEMNKDDFDYTLTYSDTTVTSHHNSRTLVLPAVADSFTCTFDSNQSVYFYYKNSTYYTDCGSMEQAKKSAYTHLYKANSISQEEYLYGIGAFSLDSITYNCTPSRTSLRSYNQFLFACYVTWEDSFSTVNNACGVHLIVYANYNNTVIELNDGYTDSDGYLLLGVDLTNIGSGLMDLYLYIETTGEHVQVLDMYRDPFWKGIYLGNQQSLNFHTDVEIHVDMSDDFGKALQFFQCAYYCAEYAAFLNNGTYLPYCDIMAHGTDSNYVYRPDENMIYFSTRNNRTNDLDGSTVHWFEDWDALGHEYGHHVQNYFPLISNGEAIGHRVGINFIEYLYDYVPHTTLDEAKDKGSRTVWCEAWASYYGQCVQKHFQSIIGQIYTVADGKVTSCNTVAYSLTGTGYRNDVYGDADEVAITQVLYQLAFTESIVVSSIPKDVYLFNLINTSATYTFGDFYNKLSGQNNNALNIFLARYLITPSLYVQVSGHSIIFVVAFEDYGTGLYFPDNYTLTIKANSTLVYQANVNHGFNLLPSSISQQLLYSHTTYSFQVSATMTYGSSTYDYRSPLQTLTC